MTAKLRQSIVKHHQTFLPSSTWRATSSWRWSTTTSTGIWSWRRGGRRGRWWRIRRGRRRWWCWIGRSWRRWAWWTTTLITTSAWRGRRRRRTGRVRTTRSWWTRWIAWTWRRRSSWIRWLRSACRISRRRTGCSLRIWSRAHSSGSRTCGNAAWTSVVTGRVWSAITVSICTSCTIWRAVNSITRKSRCSIGRLRVCSCVSRSRCRSFTSSECVTLSYSSSCRSSVYRSIRRTAWIIVIHIRT